MTLRRYSALALVALVQCHRLIDYEPILPPEATAGASGQGGNGGDPAAGSGGGGSGGGGSAGEAGADAGGAGAGAGGAGADAGGAAGASGSAGQGGDPGGAGQGGGDAGGAGSGGQPTLEAGASCEGDGAVCVGDEVFRCQFSVWTKQTCAHGCLKEQADCLRTTHIAAGNPFSCVRRSDGTIWCWGGSFFDLYLDLPLGILGKPTSELGISDKPVKIGGLGPARKVVAGRFHACALQESGQVRCWGNNAEHRTLGLPKTTVYSWEPAPVPGVPEEIEDIFAGDISTCARDKQGNHFCWGERTLGKKDASAPLYYDQGAEPAPELDGASTVALGSGHGCALFSGEVRCWGSNNAGQLAIGPPDNEAHPTPQKTMLPPLAWGGVGSGGYISLAWTENEFYGWGPNTHMAFGFSDMGVISPMELRPFWKFFKAKTFIVKQIATGFGSLCVLFEEDGVRHVRCAGLNDRFQCGGEETYAYEATDIVDGAKPLKAETIAVGWRHGCAILPGGESVKCWGIAHGNGSSKDTPTPVEVAW